jgi:hypothetical protein
MKLVAGLSPFVAISLLATAQALTTNVFWLFVSLGTAFLASLVGSTFSLMLLVRKSEIKFKWLLSLAINFCIAMYSAIHIFGAIIIFIGLSV